MKIPRPQTFRSKGGFLLLICSLALSPRLTAGDDVPLKLLNVNFGPLIGPSLEAGPAATGQSKNDFWNYYSRDDGHGGFRRSGELTKMKWADGKDSGAGLTIDNAAGSWGNGSADPMFAWYLYPLGPGTLKVVVTNLPSGIYNFYLYGHGDQNNQSGVFQLSSGKMDHGTQSTQADGAEWRLPNWNLGRQYVIFKHVLVVSGQPVTITVLPDPAHLAIISGLQIAKVDAELEFR